MIYSGLFGMTFGPKSLTFSPTLPALWGAVTLTGLHYRAAVLSVALNGSGSRIARVLYDGKPVASPVIPANAAGSHALVITLH